MSNHFFTLPKGSVRRHVFRWYVILMALSLVIVALGYIIEPNCQHSHFWELSCTLFDKDQVGWITFQTISFSSSIVAFINVPAYLLALAGIPIFFPLLPTGWLFSYLIYHAIAYGIDKKRTLISREERR